MQVGGEQRTDSVHVLCSGEGPAMLLLQASLWGWQGRLMNNEQSHRQRTTEDAIW